VNFFWGQVFEFVRERRNAMIFYGTLVVFLPVLGGIAESYGGLQYWPYALPGLGLLLLALVWTGLRQRRTRRLNRYKSSPLSRDEMIKARSKLTSKPTFK
jgi:membrane protein implicated in regulation of membrane protease activity